MLITLMGVLEVVSVTAVAPFMAMVSDSSYIERQPLLRKLMDYSGADGATEFLFLFGLGLLFLLALSAVFSMFTTWRLALWSQSIGVSLTVRLYGYYLHQPWAFHSAHHSAQLTNRISQECGRVINQIIAPLMMMNARIVLSVMMLTTIFYINPEIALVGTSLFAIVYFLLFRTVRGSLINNGRQITETNRERFKLMNEGFGGIKETLLLGRQLEFYRRFRSVSEKLGRAMASNTGIVQIPRYAVELVAFGSIILLVLYLLKSYQGDSTMILPVLSVNALACFKLLPAFQQVYASISNIKSNLSAFDSIKNELIESAESHYDYIRDDRKLIPNREIKLDAITFSYAKKDTPALKDVTLRIPVNKTIALVGESGSGKSTVVDLIMGLISPDQGSLTIDGIQIDSCSRRAWQNTIGYVSQLIFLADSTIRENIAFGIAEDEIDDDKVQKAIELAHLDSFVQSLQCGVYTNIGEKGVQLSGGQRQRVAIARALYIDAEVLVLDEATSALDGVTERMVMEAISEFSGSKTIILVAHRLATVRSSDIIYLLDNGRIKCSGTYDELIRDSELFRNMTMHA